MFAKFLDNFEKYCCQALLAVFVTVLFTQIVSRAIFGYSIAWSEELATVLFVWFAYLGASVAIRKSAHNRVTFQYKLLPQNKVWIAEVLADIVWLVFSLIILYYSYNFVFHKMNNFWKLQTLGVPMKYAYIILPLSFALMAMRIIQVNYIKFVQHKTIEDPDAVVVDDWIHHEAETQHDVELLHNKTKKKAENN